MKAFLSQLRESRWTWSFAGALLVWLITIISVEGRGAGATLTAALGFSAFYVMAGMGQMLVVAAGPGNIDLSIPSVMTLAGYLAIGAMQGQASRLWLGVLIVLGVGGLAGLANVAFIKLARVPPMVATLSAGFIMQSITIAYSKTTTAKPPVPLMDFALGRIFGIPWIAVVLILAAVVLGVIMSRSVFGRDLLAVGQSERAAYLAGIPTRRITTIVYVASAILAAITGLSARRLFRRCRARHVVRLSADVDRGRGDRRHEHYRRSRLRGRHLGRIAVSLPHLDHVECSGPWRGRPVRADGGHHHRCPRPVGRAHSRLMAFKREPIHDR